MMNHPDPRMIKFIRRHHVLTLATSSNNAPWCSSIFYAFDESPLRFVFTSGEDTRHIAEGINNSSIAGAIALETSIIGKIRGIQFSGTLKKLDGEDYRSARVRYLKRFPYSAPFLGDTPLWQIEIAYLKMTDNRLGFGKKLIWCKES